MNKVLSILILLIISFFVIGCSPKSQIEKSYWDTKILADLDIKDISKEDGFIITTFLDVNNPTKLRNFNYKLINNQLVRQCMISSKEDTIELEKMDEYAILNINSTVKKYFELKKEVETQFKMIESINLNTLKINLISKYNLPKEVYDNIVKNLRVEESSNAIDTKRIHWFLRDYAYKNQGLSVYDYIDKFYNFAEIRTSNSRFYVVKFSDFKNDVINVDISNHFFNLMPGAQIFENEDLQVITDNNILLVNYANKTDRFINIKSTSIYINQDIQRGPLLSDINLSPYGKTKNSVNFLQMNLYSSGPQKVPQSIIVNLKDLANAKIDFGYAVKYEIDGKEKTLFKTRVLTYKDFK